MKFKTQSPLHVLLFSLILIFQFSCSKDSDLLTDYVLADAKQDLVIGKFVVNDTFETAIDNPIVLDVLANDTFENTEEVVVTETTAPVNGTVEINTDNTITYIPETTEATVDTFTYTTEVILDETVSTETGTVTVIVEDPNKTTPTTDMGELLAFPGAVGFGRNTTGGRGYSVYTVSNLNDSGTGSLRQAIIDAGTAGGGTIVFTTGGTITLTSDLNFSPSYDNITIAGETAPGDGICVYGRETYILSENIIITNVRFRRGDGGTDDALRIMDQFQIGTHSNYMIDHCSMSWGQDETFSIETGNTGNVAVTNVTVSNCIISEAFNIRGVSLYGAAQTNISMIGNLFVNNEYRNVRFNTDGGDSNTPPSELEFMDNMIHHFREALRPTYAYKIDIIGNVYDTGPDDNGGYETVRMETSPGDITATKAYISDNKEDGSTSTSSANLTPYLQASRQLSSGYVSIGSSNVKASTIANAGARATMEGVDALDQDQIDHVVNDTGDYNSAESGTIGLPTLSTGTPYTDADADDMWDVAEIAIWGNITTTNNPIADEDGDGYTDIEETFFYFTGRK